MAKLPFVSIIIACKTIDQDTSKCIEECLILDYPEYEILVLPDSNELIEFDKTIVIPTGAVKPSIKRNIGMKKAKGEIFAFIDSDAYPEKDWLKNAIRYFLSSENVGAVTGPNLTPAEDNFWQQVGGDILTSFIGLGSFSRRYQITKHAYETKDIMSCNFILPKEISKNLNGFDESLLTGEDYKLGLEILAMGKRIIYSPDVCVYHHRRPVFLPHLKQMWNYGRDKGILMREFFSLDKLIYLIPSIFCLWVIVGMVISGLGNTAFKKLYILSVLIYLSTVLVDSLRVKNKNRVIYVFCGIFLTHIVYGIAFMKGLMTTKISYFETQSGGTS